MKAPAWIDRAFFAPASPLGVIAARTILALQALWVLVSRIDTPSLASWPEPFWVLTRMTQLRFGIIRRAPFPQLEPVLFWILIAALVAIVVRVMPRVSCVVASLLLYHFAPFETIASGVYDLAGHTGLTLPCLGLLVLATVDARRGDDDSPDFRWPLAFVQLILASSYFLGGMAKLHWAGLEWYSAENVSLLSAVLYTFAQPPLALTVFESRFLGGAIGVATFLLEYLFPLAIFSKWARRILIPAAVVAVFLRAQVFGFFFIGFPALLLFVNWDWVAARVRRRTTSRREMDLVTSASHREAPAEALRVAAGMPLDWHTVAELAQLHGTTQLVVENLERAGVALDPRLVEQARRNSARSFLQHRELQRLLAAFRERGITAEPYKGTTLAQRLYGKVSGRISSDIDILVPPESRDSARAALAGLGYAERSGAAPAAIDSHSHELVLVHPILGTIVELQWQAFEAGIAPSGLRSPARDADLFLLLAWHGVQHRWELLKWIADIDGFCRLPGVDWNEIADRAAELSSTRAMQLALGLAQQLFGTPVPIVLDDAAAARAAREIAEALRTESPMRRVQRLRLQWNVRERWRDRLRYFVAQLRAERGFPLWLAPFRVLGRRAPADRTVSAVQKLTTWEP